MMHLSEAILSVVGSDLSGVVLRTGLVVRTVKPGDRVVAHSLNVGLTAPTATTTRCRTPSSGIWGFETNYGDLGELALVKTNQLMPKPEHLTWEGAACSGWRTRRRTGSLCPATAPV